MTKSAADKTAEHYHYTIDHTLRQWSEEKFYALHRIDNMKFV